MPRLLVGLGCALMALALFLWRDGSGWGLFLAWVSGSWGAMLSAWGLLVGWYDSALACLAGSAFAVVAALISLLCVQRGAWDLAILCALGSTLAFVFGVYQLWFLALRAR